MSGSVLAVDIGGTKFAVALVNARGEVDRARRVATPQGGDAETLWKTLVDLIDSLLTDSPPTGVSRPEALQAEDASGGSPLPAPGPGESRLSDPGPGSPPPERLPVEGVGVGCGGPMTWPEGVVSPLNMPGWRGFPLRARLAELFPGVPVRVHNDAVCVAVAEHWRGAGRGSANMLGMVVSTGVGGGLVLGDRLIDGGSGNAGHVGHIVVEPGGPVCGCGARGCLEAVARGPALAAWAVGQGWTPGALTGGVSHRATGGVSQQAAGGASHQVSYVEAAVASGRQLALDADAGDEIALAAMNRAGRALGLAVAAAVNLCDLDIVTVGGGLSQAGRLLFDPLETTLREHTRMEFARRARVVPASLGQDAGLVGAAALILAADRYWPH
ncbi:ROK family protein [Streptosporangium carneum]|uniref:Sugar kinase n=1 Tax=Streptosporangium carneum TaxID=47481 RepID=A0A9W6MEI4_9ACTN|nr:ROK family protein [Streptosporangium carneum]GLK11619.1 sugar kinase [Streptosporangium carneum]